MYQNRMNRQTLIVFNSCVAYMMERELNETQAIPRRIFIIPGMRRTHIFPPYTDTEQNLIFGRNILCLCLKMISCWMWVRVRVRLSFKIRTNISLNIVWKKMSSHFYLIQNNKIGYNLTCNSRRMVSFPLHRYHAMRYDVIVD